MISTRSSISFSSFARIARHSLLYWAAVLMIATPAFAQSETAEAEMAEAKKAEAKPAMADEAKPADTSFIGSLGLAPYLEYNAGVAFVPNQSLQGDSSAAAGLWGRTKQDDAGYVVGGALGTKILGDFRAELNLSFRSTSLEEIAVQGEPPSARGDVSLFAIMANGYYDFDFGDDAMGFVPYLGAGIGWGLIRLDGQNAPGALQLSLDDTDSVFVYNVMAGVQYEVSKLTTLNVGYRYIATGEVLLSATSAGNPQRLEYEYDGHEVVAGLRFNF